MNELITRARALLECLGYAFQEGDEGFLKLCAERVTEEIRCTCNTAEVPQELVQAASGWTAAEFLLGKKSMGRLEGIEGFDYEAAVQTIQEGDTTVRYFEHASSEDRLDQLIARLKPDREALLAFRRLKW